MKILLIGASGCFGTEFINACDKFKKIKLKHYRSKQLNILDFEKLSQKINILNQIL